jgi:hypothetical protein
MLNIKLLPVDELFDNRNLNMDNMLMSKSKTHSE